MPPVTSRQNPIVARFRAAARGETPGMMLLDGIHLVSDALEVGTRLLEVAVGTDAADRPDTAQILERLDRLNIPVTVATSLVMSALSPVRSSSPVVAIAAQPESDESHIHRGGLILMAIDVQDPGNLGAIVRVAEAGGADGVVCAGACANPFGWKALRGAMGSTLRMPIVVLDSAEMASTLARRQGRRIVATVPRGGRELFEVDLTGPVALLIGSEGSGLPPSQGADADERVTIPMESPVESLNAAVTAALVVYEARRQRAALSR